MMSSNNTGGRQLLVDARHRQQQQVMPNHPQQQRINPSPLFNPANNNTRPQQPYNPQPGGKRFLNG